MARRVTRSTKSGSYTGFRKGGPRRGRAVPRLSRAEGRSLGLLRERHRKAAHTRRKAR